MCINRARFSYPLNARQTDCRRKIVFPLSMYATIVLRAPRVSPRFLSSKFCQIKNFLSDHPRNFSAILIFTRLPRQKIRVRTARVFLFLHIFENQTERLFLKIPLNAFFDVLDAHFCLSQVRFPRFKMQITGFLENSLYPPVSSQGAILIKK